MGYVFLATFIPSKMVSTINSPSRAELLFWSFSPLASCQNIFIQKKKKTPHPIIVFLPQSHPEHCCAASEEARLST